jgi:hypothetical protein
LEWARSVRTASLAQQLAEMPEAELRRLVELLPLLEALVVSD